MDDKEKMTVEKNKKEFDAHRVIVLWLFLSTFVITVFVAALLIYAEVTKKDVITILPIVILAGILGSFVSALNRIYSATDIFPVGKYTDLLKEANVYLIAYSSIPPLVGAISATILYLFFAAQLELVTSPVFPKFACKNEMGCTEFLTFQSYWGPKEAEDYAKAIVWGFIAGFSERFVPDILNRITTESNNENT